MQKGDFVLLPVGKGVRDTVGKILAIKEDGKALVEFVIECEPQDLEVLS